MYHHKHINNSETAFLGDDQLFGNEAGEDEPIEILNSYFVEKPEFREIYDEDTPYRIIKSKKGVGKSTLLKKSLSTIESTLGEKGICVYLKGSDLLASQKVEPNSPNEHINAWQQRISSFANQEIGSRIKFAASDYKISMVEAAELNGFKQKNFVSSLLDRISYKDSLPEIQRKNPSNNYELFKRSAEKNSVHVWLFIDDIDATFINEKTSSLQTSTFFTACRAMATTIPGLRIRCSVRSDVWEVLAAHDEALDKCNQYLLDLKWTNRESQEILARKIISYFRRKHPTNDTYQNLDYPDNCNKIFDLVFTKRFMWNGSPVPPDKPIFIFSAGRPRWAAHLCKLAAKSTLKSSRSRISISDIDSSLKQYGEFRLRDLYKEHGHQCSKLKEIIECFAGGPRRYRTRDLLQKLTSSIIQKHGSVKIDGAHSYQGAIGLAHFIYRIGFVHGRDGTGKNLSFVRFEDRPDLLTTSQNLDDGLEWEIHPSYRNVLRIKRGFETKTGGTEKGVNP